MKNFWKIKLINKTLFEFRKLNSPPIGSCIDKSRELLEEFGKWKHVKDQHIMPLNEIAAYYKHYEKHISKEA